MWSFWNTLRLVNVAPFKVIKVFDISESVIPVSAHSMYLAVGSVNSASGHSDHRQFLKITLIAFDCLLWLIIFQTVKGHNLIQAKVQPPSDKSGNETPLKSFVLLERHNSIKTVQHVHTSLAALSKVIRGQQLLTSEVQNLASALINLEVRQLSSTLTNELWNLFCNRSFKLFASAIN